MHPKISQYQSDPEYAYLQKKVIHLDGRPPHVPARDILIMESCGLLSFRLGSIQTNMKLVQSSDGMAEVRTELYSILACCSFGDVPTVGQFFALPPKDINDWIAEVRLMNPDLFLKIDAYQKILAGIVEKISEEKVKEEIKKKGGKRPKSASG